jgi:hypothetical protein
MTWAAAVMHNILPDPQGQRRKGVRMDCAFGYLTLGAPTDRGADAAAAYPPQRNGWPAQLVPGAAGAVNERREIRSSTPERMQPSAPTVTVRQRRRAVTVP